MIYDNITYPLDRIYSQATGVAYAVSGANGSSPVPPTPPTPPEPPTPPTPPVEPDYFYIELGNYRGEEIPEFGLSVSADINNTLNLEYSLDKTNWTTFDGFVDGLAEGDKVYFRNDTGTFSDDEAYTSFYTDETEFNAGGEITTLLDYTGVNKSLKPNCFIGLFKESIFLVSAGNLVLPEETADNCYSEMFKGCTSLTTAPELPSVTLSSGCYSSMFKGCDLLQTAPAELPATTLSDFCYQEMFEGCVSLNVPPTIAAQTLAVSCCWSMFEGCTVLPYAPELYATTTEEGCYVYMFKNCSSLEEVVTHTQFPDRSLYEDFPFENWLDGVAAQGFLVNFSGTQYEEGPSGVPVGWTETDSFD